ncbi:MAG: ribonuclease III [Actinomycetaceae bacterium]|nr:ribonuclease III [Actinomycetaceae bacterium]
MTRRRSHTQAPPAATNSNIDELLGAWRISLDPGLVITALTHRSFAFEAGGIEHNERLEFLGDSVLSIIVTDYLFKKYPEVSESELSRMRGAIVSERTLAEVARSLNLGDFILLGKGENLTGGRKRDSILCDTVEAMIGATYISFGLDTTRAIVETHLKEHLENAVELGRSSDYRTTLQEYCSQKSLGEPIYEATGSGPDHERVFSATVTVGGVEIGRGTGPSKKTAKSDAAKHGYHTLLEQDKSA